MISLSNTFLSNNSGYILSIVVSYVLIFIIVFALCQMFFEGNKKLSSIFSIIFLLAYGTYITLPILNQRLYYYKQEKNAKEKEKEKEEKANIKVETVDRKREV